MTESSQLSEGLSDDLRFVRKAVEAKQQPGRRSAGALVIWTVYSLVCMPAYDFVPRYAQLINLAGWLIAMFITFWVAKKMARRTGEYDRAEIQRRMLHWIGGILLLFVAVYGLAFSHSGVGEVAAGQVSVIIVGFLYFTAGVHFPESRFMRWAGPVIVIAGVAIGWLPHLRWTATGLIFAVCLMSPVIFGGRKPASVQPV